MTNHAYLSGEILTEPVFSHEIHEVKLFRSLLTVPRLSGNVDVVPLLCPEAMLGSLKGEIAVSGQIRGYTYQAQDGRHLHLCVLVRHIELPGQEKENNRVELTGELCREPYSRKTPMGREIADLCLRVSRPYAGTDYIPCVVWGKCAAFCGHLHKGALLSVAGRLQSREYTKSTQSGSETKTAYELSVNNLKVLSF